jgi:hypothetical protein
MLPALVLALLDPITLPDCASCMIVSLILASLSLSIFTSIPSINVVVKPSDVDGMIDVRNPEYKSRPVVLLLNDDNGSADPDPVDVLYGDVSRSQAISVAPVVCVTVVGLRKSVYAITPIFIHPCIVS